MEDLARLGVDRRVVLVRLERRERLERSDRASSGPNSIVWRLVISVSRPKTVMNHGIPAAGSLPRPSPMRMRSAARSATDCWYAWRRSSDWTRSCGTSSCHFASESRTLSRSAPKRCSTTLGGSSTPDSDATTSTRSCQISRGASSSWKHTRRPSILHGSEKSTCVFAPPFVASSRTSWFAAASKRASAGAGSGRAVSGSPEREVVLLHGEDVREVGADLELELERERLGALVAQDQVILHALADEALAHDRERVLREPGNDRVAQVEGGGEVLDLPRREQERADAVDAELERERKRVSSANSPLVLPSRSPISSQMQKVDPSRIVSAIGTYFRTMRAPLDCAMAFTTISSMFTCAGRVNANRTQSATSSAVTGSRPA